MLNEGAQVLRVIWYYLSKEISLSTFPKHAKSQSIVAVRDSDKDIQYRE